MPRFDGTGPEGKGSKTGRGLGNCTGGNRIRDIDITNSINAKKNARFGLTLRRRRRDSSGGGIGRNQRGR